MSKIKSTIWKIDPHTEAKHIILRKYLDAWLPIIARGSKKILYIDGFAGPGEYIGKKEGSPIIAINAVLEHTAKIDSEIIMLFLEKKKSRYDFLKQKLSSLSLPPKLKYECYHGEFHKKMEEIINHIEKENSSLAPAFIFIDPFGFTGIPFSIIKDLMKNPKCEVLITFMYSSINRFIKEKSLWKHFKETFGTDEWKAIVKEKNAEKRMNFLHELYKRQLKKKAKINFVRSFMMKSKFNKPDYFLFFGTNHLLGLIKMKEAMWKVDETGRFSFSDATYNPNQPMLFDEVKPNYSILKKALLNKYKNKAITIKELRYFVNAETAFLEKHCNYLLRKMEKGDPPEIKRLCDKCQHDKTCKRRKYFFQPHCRIKFLQLS